MFIGAIILVLLVSFLLGSIPWGVVISKVFYHIDVREYGSGNIGTTNSFRAMGKVGGSAVFVLDFAKGLLSGIFAMCAIRYLTGDALIEGSVAANAAAGTIPSEFFLLYGIAFLGCILGHMFSPWLRFHGGKGIAVAVGCLCVVLHGWGALFEFLLWLVLVLITKYVSVGSIAAAVTVPFLSCYYYTCVYPFPWTIIFFTVAGALITWAHRSNIQRLKNHTENRVGGSKKQA